MMGLFIRMAVAPDRMAGEAEACGPNSQSSSACLVWVSLVGRGMPLGLPTNNPSVFSHLLNGTVHILSRIDLAPCCNLKMLV